MTLVSAEEGDLTIAEPFVKPIAGKSLIPRMGIFLSVQFAKDSSPSRARRVICRFECRVTRFDVREHRAVL